MRTEAIPIAIAISSPTLTCRSRPRRLTRPFRARWFTEILGLYGRDAPGIGPGTHQTEDDSIRVAASPEPGWPVLAALGGLPS